MDEKGCVEDTAKDEMQPSGDALEPSETSETCDENSLKLKNNESGVSDSELQNHSDSADERLIDNTESDITLNDNEPKTETEVEGVKTNISNDENDFKTNDELDNDTSGTQVNEPNDTCTSQPEQEEKDIFDDEKEEVEGKKNKKTQNNRETSKPEFETAPNVSLEETHEDNSQAFDPFDALLKDIDSSVTNKEKDVPVNADVHVNAENDDDNHDADVDAALDDEDVANDDHPDEVKKNESIEESHVADDTVDEPGADEDVCLIPDTDRELSEADKAEAEKLLAEKRRQAEAEAEQNAVLKEEFDGAETEDQANAEDTANADSSSTGGAGEFSQDGLDKEVQAEIPAEDEVDENSVKIINQIHPVEAICEQCNNHMSCIYTFQDNDDKDKYICSNLCASVFYKSHPTKYSIKSKKYFIQEIAPKKLTCSECEETKCCYFYYNYDGEDTFYCSLLCLHSMMADEKDKYYFEKRLKIRVMEQTEKIEKECVNCNETVNCTFKMDRYGKYEYICSINCVKQLNDLENGRYIIITKTKPAPLLKLKVISNATDKYLDEAYKIQAKTPAMIQAARAERENTFTRRCTQCTSSLNLNDKNLMWETLDFCDEICLGRYQNKIGSNCANCKNVVIHSSLGKYCVRFGFNIRQFCNSACLEEFKKGLKICCYCQRDISAGSGFLAPVGDKGQFKDFCTQICMGKYDQMNKNSSPQPVWAKCAVCSLEKVTNIEVEVSDDKYQRLCSDPCFAAFKFVNNIVPDQCRLCKKYFERKESRSYTIYEESTPNCFCSQSCMNVFISNSRHIVSCNWCKVKKYNFDMICRIIGTGQGQMPMMCSLNCLNLYQVSVNAVSSRRIKCDMCKRTSLAQYHLTMSDATVRNFCTYQCVMAFQARYSKHVPPAVLPGDIDQHKPAVPAGSPRRTYPGSKNNAASNNAQQQKSSSLPVISNVQSLAAPPPLAPTARAKTRRQTRNVPAEPVVEAPVEPPPPPKPVTPPPPPPPKVYNHVIVKTLPPKEVANKGTMSKPKTASKGVSCRPHPCTKECQTDASLERRVLIPVPVPIYVPVPCVMWSIPFPVPVPIPIPIPTPIFVPTTRNSAKGIMKEINKIHDKMPTDPFEAELLMMAEMVAGDKKKDQSDSDTEDDNVEEGFSPVPAMDGNNAFGEDMLQMALKMATEYEDQPVDLESAMTANTITSSSTHPGMPGIEPELHQQHLMMLEQQRAVAALRSGAGLGAGAGAGAGANRKRAPPAATRPSRGKRGRRPEPAPEPPREPQEKPDANMCLKYTFGVNAWKQWVMTKNAEIEKSSIRRKPFKSEILQLTADELNYSLCLFVKEVRKPNGSEYAPDTIYYLVLGIQQYLFENSRIDNIFTDPYYEKFTDCLDEVARKFSVLYNDSQYIVTRVEEEHLWESKQLGAHSPHVLLSTLMFFNTKHFNLVTVDEHMQLSFSHIMKHWKRNPNQPGQAKIPGSRNVLLRFYPPQSALEANSRKKKVYEQQENEENPLRCPVKLYEFYISKCPESVRTRNDVFYLQPERSCVPDSPVWYSTQPLSRHALAKMLHRVKMVKEINIALLTS